MAKILTPVRGYNGVSATVRFIRGAGQCDDPYLLDWFRSHGYTVVEERPVETEAEATPENVEIPIEIEAEATPENVEIPIETEVKKPKKKTGGE